MGCYVIAPGTRTGRITAPASKSQLHRLLICGALSAPSAETAGNLKNISMDDSDDIRATKKCLLALKAGPAQNSPDGLLHMACGESGSTLRFLLPLCGALDKRAVFHREGSLVTRPLAPFDRELRAHGMEIREEGCDLYCSGTLQPGTYTIPGNISSQYISGLLMALPLLDGDSSLRVVGPLQSAAYVTMTLETLAAAGVQVRTVEEEASADGVNNAGVCVRNGTDADKRDRRICMTVCYEIPGRQQYRLPADSRVDGDWSNAAAFLCMGALSREGIRVDGLAKDSQGDRAVLTLLRRMGAAVTVDCCPSLADGSALTGLSDGRNPSKRKAPVSVLVKAPADGILHGTEVDAGQVPDLVPVLSALAMYCHGTTRICNGARLRLKESDRLENSAALVRAFGGDAAVNGDELLISGTGRTLSADPSRAAFHGAPVVETCKDHRIAMAAAVAACGADKPVTIDDFSCVAKSYPSFWDDFGALRLE